MSRKLRVGVIFGGRSGEHEISILSAATVMEALDSQKYEVVPVGITKEGRWLLGGDAMRALREGTPEHDSPRAIQRTAATSQGLIPTIGRESVGHLQLDVVFPVLHGPYGEDGTVQGLLELTQIPYVGSGVLASAVGMDKAVMKDIFRQHSIPVVPSIVVKRASWRARPEEVHAAVERALGYPCFVKPANLGSSVGISKVHSPEQLPGAMSEAAQYDRKIVVELAVPDCREIEVSVLGNDEPIASVPGEIIPGNEFYDYAAKYLDDNSRLMIPAELPPETTCEVQRLAVAAFKALDCAGMARVDSFLAGNSGRVFVNEVNTIPGFTRISMYPKLWEASGMSITALLDRLVELAIERFEDKNSSRTTYR